MDRSFGGSSGRLPICTGRSTRRHLRESTYRSRRLIDRAWAVGGGARSTLWLEILASALDMSIDLPEAAEIGGAFGAARLAICAATGAAWQDVMTPPRRAATIEPEAALRDAYAESIARWRTVARALAAIDLPTSPGG